MYNVVKTAYVVSLCPNNPIKNLSKFEAENSTDDSRWVIDHVQAMMMPSRRTR